MKSSLKLATRSARLRLEVLKSLSLASVLCLTGCNAQELQQLEAALNLHNPLTATGSAPSGAPTPDIQSDCFYTTSLAYDLGPDIDVKQSFDALGKSHQTYQSIRVLQTVTDSNASGCPVHTFIPAVGEQQSSSVYEVTSSGGHLNIYNTSDSLPTILQEMTSATPTSGASGSSAEQVTLSMAVPKTTYGNITQIFNQGILESATTQSNAHMTLNVTYDYSTATRYSSSGRGH